MNANSIFNRALVLGVAIVGASALLSGSPGAGG